METLKVAQQIQDGIDNLELLKLELCKFSTIKDEAATAYDKSMALTIIKLRNGEEFNLSGELVKDVPVTSMEKIAKGICWKEQLDANLAESKYQNLRSQITISLAQLSAWQTIFKTLGEI